MKSTSGFFCDRTLTHLEKLLVCLCLSVGCMANGGVLPPEVESDFQKVFNPTSFLIEVTFEEKLAQLPRDQKSEAMTRLRGGLSSPHCEVRRRTALVLSHLKDNAGVPVMIKDMATVTNRNDRNNVVVALRIMKDRRAIPILTKITSDPSAYVRSIALAALGELAATNSYDVIMSRVTDLENFGGDVSMCPGDAACYALGALGDKRAIPVLMKALDQIETQSQACQALEKLTGQPFRYDVEKWKSWWNQRQLSADPIR